MKLQIAGQATDVDNVLLRGTPCAAGFAIFHLKGDRIQCVEAINSPQDFLVGKQFISARTHTDPSTPSNPAITLKAAVIRPALHTAAGRVAGRSETSRGGQET